MISRWRIFARFESLAYDNRAFNFQPNLNQFGSSIYALG